MAAIVFNRPEGVIIVRATEGMGDRGAMFGIWPNGLVRRLTAAEWTLWGSPEADHVIPFGNDAEYIQLAQYDAALRGGL